MTMYCAAPSTARLSRDSVALYSARAFALGAHTLEPHMSRFPGRPRETLKKHAGLWFVPFLSERVRFYFCGCWVYRGNCRCGITCGEIFAFAWSYAIDFRLRGADRIAVRVLKDGDD